MKSFAWLLLVLVSLSLSTFSYASIPLVEVEVAHPRSGEAPPATYFTGADWPEGHIALTFDDGPHPLNTLKVLEMLRNYGVRATFFMVGQMAEWHPEAARQVLKEGHTVATHSYRHPSVPGLGYAGGMAEINHGIAAVTQVLGQSPAQFFRFPFLSSTAELRAGVAQEGLSAIGWNGLFEGTHLAPVDGHLKQGVLVTHDLQGDILTTLPIILRDMEKYGYTAVVLVPPKSDANN